MIFSSIFLNMIRCKLIGLAVSVRMMIYVAVRSATSLNVTLIWHETYPGLKKVVDSDIFASSLFCEKAYSASRIIRTYSYFMKCQWARTRRTSVARLGLRVTLDLVVTNPAWVTRDTFKLIWAGLGECNWQKSFISFVVYESCVLSSRFYVCLVACFLTNLKYE